MKHKKSIILTSVFTALSVLTTLSFCGFRFGFIFVDHYVFDGFCCVLWSLFILNTVILFFQLRGSIRGNRLYNKKLFIVNTVFSVISFICCIAFIIIGGEDELLNYFYMSFETLPYLALFYAFIFFTAVLPVCRQIFHKITAVIVSAAIIVCAIVIIFPAGGFDFESKPAVFDTGDGYHIVFATNRKSVGYVKISDSGNDKIVWDTLTGRKESSRVHSIKLSYDELNNKEYSIGAVRAVEDIAYGGHLGKEITLLAGKFTPCPEDDFDMTCITDNHSSRPNWETMGKDAEIFVFLGDIANGIYTYDSFINNLIVPAGKISGGIKPVVYVLGNHDHRGSKVPDLMSSLDFDEFYYRLNIGKYVFTVLDSGEDKEDENYEYGGYNDYSSYFSKQTEWARNLQKEKGYNIILTHSPIIFYEPDEKQSPVCEIMRNLGEELIICGHIHTAEFVDKNESKTGIAYYICGGKTDARNINYTKMHFNQGLVDIRSESTQGELILEKQLRLSEIK